MKADFGKQDIPCVVELTIGEISTLLMACGYFLASEPPGNLPDLTRSATRQLVEAMEMKYREVGPR